MDGYLKIYVLQELSNHESSGYDLIKKISFLMGKKPSAGSIYPILNDLLKNKLISIKKDGRKKIYSLTKKGKKSINIILKEKEELILKHILLFKKSSKLLGKKTSESLVESLKILNKNTPKCIETLEVLSELRMTLIDLVVKKKYPKYEERIKEILKETTKKLKSLK